VLGITSSVTPIEQGDVGPGDLAVMLLFSLLLMRFAHTGWRMERWEGALLLVGFGIYLAMLLA
jgi:cation:H+ antiporter